MRLLGDEYIKHEFRQHQKIENPIHIVRYLHNLEYTDELSPAHGDYIRSAF